jgi:hypothetical protein
VPLTEIERGIAKSVAQSFYVQREAISHEQLLRLFNDPRPIIALKDRYRIITEQGNSGQGTYLPTILAFEYCGDETLRQNARAAVETVVGGLKVLFMTDYNTNREHPASALIDQLRTANTVPIPDQIWLGLFLVRQLPGVLRSAQQNETNTAVTSFRINDHILTLEPKDVWDEYIRTHNTVDRDPKPQSAAEEQTPSLAGRGASLDS